LPDSFSDYSFSLARKARALETRAKLIQSIRNFFIHNGFLEVETPLRLPSPAPEEHIEAIRSEDWFLQTSPELCMKRLLAAGYRRIFQISPCFRAAERGDRHLPEFTMLEWYVAGFDYQKLMGQCEALVGSVAQSLGVTKISRLNNSIDLSPPWERITVEDAFTLYAPVSVEDAMARDTFEEILVDYIEPQLGMNRPTLMYDYPAKLAALAKLKDQNPSVCERFELYIGGLEIANGFSELTDETEQRRRFEYALKKRAEKNLSRYIMPEPFLLSLETLPPAAGIALGIDRLAMVITGAEKIDEVVAFTPEIL
jgi:lysyl-tRNA synthetase class 2